MRAALPTDYASALALRLASGAARLPARFLAREAAYVAAAQRPDGGFAGRRGGSDLYYTSFGLRCAEMLGWDETGFRDRAARHAAAAPPPRDVVECLCLLHVQRLAGPRDVALASGDLAAVVRGSRSAAGGYAIAPGAEPGVYHTFLAALCLQMLGAGFEGAADAAAFVLSCQCGDGGFADSARRGAADGGTNPTAAAAAVLAALGALDPATAGQATRFLASMQRPGGGFAANASAPEADLLSTFTALAALGDLGAAAPVKLAPIGRFVRALRAPDGGFRGSADDDAPDIEYTYYGLGTLALLATAAAGGGHDG